MVILVRQGRAEGVKLSLDRRRYPRWQVRCPVRFKVLGERGTYVGSLSRDLSAGGVKIITDRFVRKDSAVKVEVFLENVKRMVEAWAKVIWLEQVPYGGDMFRMGLKFENIDPKDKEYIHRLSLRYSMQ